MQRLFLVLCLGMFVLLAACGPKQNDQGHTTDQAVEHDPNACLSDTVLIPDDEPCPAIYSPVCGCDGNTYGNECTARRNRVLKWTTGKCDEQDTTAAPQAPDTSSESE